MSTPAAKKETFKTRGAWLKARGIGGSEVGAIMGTSKFLTLDDVYTAHTRPEKAEDEKTGVMVRGTKAEEHIRRLFALDHFDEYKVTNPPRKGAWLWRRKDKPYMTCTPDGLLKDLNTGDTGVLEIKYADILKSEAKQEWEGNTIPSQYLSQCVNYLAVNPRWKFVVLTAYLKSYRQYEEGWKFDKAERREYVLYRKEFANYIRYQEMKETEFWEKHVLPHERPGTEIDL